GENPGRLIGNRSVHRHRDSVQASGATSNFCLPIPRNDSFPGARMREQHKEDRLKGEALVDGEGAIWLPYDLPHRRHSTESWTLISERREVLHAGRRRFRRRTSYGRELHVLNGMGVTLGDSVIGMSVLAWVKAEHPSLQIHVYRSPHTPAYVERLY